MTRRTNEQNRRLHAILSKVGMMDMKRQFAFEASSGRTDKTSELFQGECESLIRGLESSSPTWQNDPLNKIRRRVYHLCHELAWKNDDGSVNQRTLNSWLISDRCKAKKLLNDQTADELRQTIFQLEQMLRKDYEGQNKG